MCLFEISGALFGISGRNRPKPRVYFHGCSGAPATLLHGDHLSDHLTSKERIETAKPKGMGLRSTPNTPTPCMSADNSYGCFRSRLLPAYQSTFIFFNITLEISRVFSNALEFSSSSYEYLLV